VDAARTETRAERIPAAHNELEIEVFLFGNLVAGSGTQYLACEERHAEYVSVEETNLVM